jgi:hypothetical protein
METIVEGDTIIYKNHLGKPALAKVYKILPPHDFNQKDTYIVEDPVLYPGRKYYTCYLDREEIQPSTLKGLKL